MTHLNLLASLDLVPATLVTLGGLCGLLGVLWAIGRLIAASLPPIPTIVPAPAPVALVPTEESDELTIHDPRLIAIITAAATVALGRSAVVTRLTFTNRKSATSWAEFGRADIHLSHRVR